MMAKRSSNKPLNPIPLVGIVGLLLLFVVFISRFIVGSNVLGTSDSVGGKEFYIPFGTGTNTSTDWIDVGGVAAYVDSRLYGKIKKVVFEASLGIPSGNQTAYVRLFNATDKHPVWYSEISLSGSTPSLITSSAITLDSGNKLYQVQMKSQLGAPTNLLLGRIHIVTY